MKVQKEYLLQNHSNINQEWEIKIVVEAAGVEYDLVKLGPFYFFKVKPTLIQRVNNMELE